jgi:hypothetical protein
MASPQSEPADAPPLPPVKLDPLAALMSYLIPGLGQVYQGRVGKGLLFFFGLYVLFFYGMWMGQWRNVWLPDASDLPDVTVAGQNLGGAFKAAYYRPQFLGQFWIGAAAWPSVVQYVKYDKAKQEGPAPFKKFQRAPTEDELNDLQRNSSKRWDLGWVYTVIAGVLNLLVIYDALAGPMFRDPPRWTEDAPEESTPAAEPAAVPAATAKPAAPPPPAPVPFPAAPMPADSPAPVVQESEPAANPPGGAS